MRAGEIWRSVGQAAELSGRSRWLQLAEMARLRVSANKIKPHEYFAYRLFRPDLSSAERKRFIGSWTRDGVYSPNNPADAARADYKLTAYELFDRQGLPHPRVRAVVNCRSDYPGCARLAAAEETAEFLRNARYPLFIKPNRSFHGWGAKLIDRFEDGMLHLRDGTQLTPEALAAELIGTGEAMLVQDAIIPHPAIAAMTGGGAATGRVLVLMLDGRPLVHSAVLRIPRGKSMIDNFQGGASGNMLAEIDVATGVCRAAVAGIGFKHAIVARHPDSGGMIEGLQIPDWREVVDVLERAASLFPGLMIQGWDIAFGEQGPLLLENNSKSEFRIIQHGTQRGLIDPHFRRAARL